MKCMTFIVLANVLMISCSRTGKCLVAYDEIRLAEKLPVEIQQICDFSLDGYPFDLKRSDCATLLREGGVEAAVDYILCNANYSSYHLLMALRDQSPDLLNEIPLHFQAAIICHYMRYIKVFNEFDFTRSGAVESSGGSYLLSLGDVAVPYLKSNLNVNVEVVVAGTSRAMHVHENRYRVCDYCLFYLHVIDGTSFEIPDSIDQRDNLISTLCK